MLQQQRDWYATRRFTYYVQVYDEMTGHRFFPVIMIVIIPGGWRWRGRDLRSSAGRCIVHGNRKFDRPGGGGGHRGRGAGAREGGVWHHTITISRPGWWVVHVLVLDGGQNSRLGWLSPVLLWLVVCRNGVDGDLVGGCCRYNAVGSRTEDDSVLGVSR